MVCRICNNPNNNKYHLVKEMMFGLREKFEYLECGACGCLQISQIPEDIAKYYPQDFYSFATVPESSTNPVEMWLRRQRMKFLLQGHQSIGWLLSKVLRKTFGTETPQYYYNNWFRRIQLSSDAEILDVGCGAGTLLLSMHLEGFTNLTGIDPFIEKDILYANGVKVLKKALEEMVGQFDFIMLNHAFEHMHEPLVMLKALYQLLKPNSYVLLRMPVAGCLAWHKYGTNWVAIDAPRHVYIHTVKSTQILAEKAGFVVQDISFDSHAYQFWASEQILKNIAVTDSNSYAINPSASIFCEKDIKAFAAQAEELNKTGEGDAALFYLYKS
jgi:2-polyprenyl-3-methyl-5-hydroxy-6-metoxy-1,4-benzoquinol methylase